MSQRRDGGHRFKFKRPGRGGARGTHPTKRTITMAKIVKTHCLLLPTMTTNAHTRPSSKRTLRPSQTHKPNLRARATRRQRLPRVFRPRRRRWSRLRLFKMRIHAQKCPHNARRERQTTWLPLLRVSKSPLSDLRSTGTLRIILCSLTWRCATIYFSKPNSDPAITIHISVRMSRQQMQASPSPTSGSSRSRSASRTRTSLPSTTDGSFWYTGRRS